MIEQKSNVYKGKDALRGMLNGMKIVSDLVETTYGAKGGNVAIFHEDYPYHEIVNDAQSFVQKTHGYDELENFGIGFYKELCDKADKDNGDARKTTILLTAELLEQGFESQIHPLELKRELQELLPIIEKSIDDQTIPVTTSEQIGAVATIASESPILGKLISDIYEEIGKNGIIRPEYVLGQKGNNYKVIDGIRFVRTGYLSEEMTYDEDARNNGRKEKEAVYENPFIIVTKRRMDGIDDLSPILNSLFLNRDKLKSDGTSIWGTVNPRNVVIFTSDMDSNLSRALISHHKDATKFHNVTIIKAPILWKDYVYKDFAACVGATIIEDASGITFKTFDPLKHAGTCDKIIIDKENTTILGSKDISQHIADLKAEGSNDSQLRLSWLVNKTALLNIGADSDSELGYLRLKLSDGIASAYHAQRGGIIPGGGLALWNSGKNLPKTKASFVLKSSLEKPMRQIVFNSGLSEIDYTVALSIVGTNDGKNGFDAKSNMIVNIIDSNIIDSAIIVKNAIKNAISLASTVLTCSSGIILKKKLTSEESTDLVMQKMQRPLMQ